MLETAQPSGGAATRQSAAPAEQYKVDLHSQVLMAKETPAASGAAVRRALPRAVRSKTAAKPWPPPIHIVSRP